MSISLEKSVRTCKVDPGWANRIESDRFFSPDLMVCAVWNGRDSFGRQVAPDSFYTKTAGCNSAQDRVIVENQLRPQYSEYVVLDAAGIEGAIYGPENYKDNMFVADSMIGTKGINQLSQVTGYAGQDMRGQIAPRCSSNAYEFAQSQLAAQNRQAQFAMSSFKSANNQVRAGLY
jgi:hypothetical protein